MNTQDSSLGSDRSGASYTRILRYFYPEFITALIVYFLPQFIDCYFICTLKSTSLYTISGIVENFLGLFTKSAEGLLIGTVIISGYFNGAKEYKKAGSSFVHAFWITLLIGFFVALLLYYGVVYFYTFNNFSDDMIQLGTPYLRIKAVGVFFLFFYFSLVGFFRAVKNTFTPMVIFTIGNMLFIVFDYLLIFGAYGFPKLGLLGSAVSYLIQYVFMSFSMLFYIMCSQEYKKYEISIWSVSWNKETVILFIKNSIPVVIDKISIAFAYVWLGSCISQFGLVAGASFSMIKLMERIAFVPAIAFSQIMTFLVSNDRGEQKWDAVYSHIKKIVLLACCFVGSILLIGSCFPGIIVQLFGCSEEVQHVVTTVFPWLSPLVMIDLLQLILSAALRGAGAVKVVMITRLLIIGFYFIPMTYVIHAFNLQGIVMNIGITYATFLIGNIFMTLVYIKTLMNSNWKKQNIKVKHD